MSQYNTANNTNNEVMVLSFENQSLDTRIIDNELWFAANNLAKMLGFGNPRQAISTHVEIEDVQKLDTLTKGGKQAINFVNESGMYALIFGSTKAEAKRFKHWVTSKVLPQIRKTGRYSVEKASTPTDADWQRYSRSMTIPEMARFTDHSEQQVINALHDIMGSPTRANSPAPVMTAELKQALDQFWGFVAQQNITSLNHSQAFGMLALSIPEVYALAKEGELPDSSLIYKALRLSQTPRFYRANIVITSSLLGRSRRVWVFLKYSSIKIF